jgi:hypothetical protein
MDSESSKHHAFWAITVMFMISLVIPETGQCEGIGLDSILCVEYGDNAGFGQDEFPTIVLGLPMGGGPEEGSLHVLSLGKGGSITAIFVDEYVVDGPGPDLVIFENPFFIQGDSSNSYVEAAVIQIGPHPDSMVLYPFDFVPALEPAGNPDKFVGMAGVMPVNSNDGIPDPQDPDSSGGDLFDLSQVGLENAQYIRIIDVGDTTYDPDSELVVDPGWDGSPSAGFDLDACVAIHWTDATDPFRVDSAVAYAPDTLIVDLSKELSLDLNIQHDWFLLNGEPLDPGDLIWVSSPSELTVVLIVTPPLSPPMPVLEVDQSITSSSGENLLDRYGKEVLNRTSSCTDHPHGATLEQQPPLLIARPTVSRGTITFTVLPVSQGRHTPGAKVLIYNLAGQLVASLPLVHGSAEWDGTSQIGGRLPSGCYLCRALIGGEQVATKVIVHR